MSLDRYNRGLMQDPTTALRFSCHGTASSALTAIVNGTTYPAVAVLDSYGMGFVDITGLTPDTSYSVELQEDGVTDFTAICRTCPTDSMKLHWFSCVADGSPFWAGYLMKERNPDMILDLGDNPYSAATASPSWHSVANTTQALPLTELAYTDVHNRTLKNPGMIAIRDIGYGYMYDDHDIAAGDDWDHTVLKAQQQNDISGNDGVASPPTQKNVNDVFAMGVNVIDELRMMGNPDNDDDNTDPLVASQALIDDSEIDYETPTTSVYKARYFRFGNDVVDVLVTDHQTHRDPQAKIDNSSKTMLGSEQKAWLKAQMLASTARVVVWMSSKYLFPLDDEAAGSDRWDKWSTERDEILQYAEDNNILLIIPSGDKHVPLIGKVTTDSNDVYETDTYNAVNVNACPSGVVLSNHASLRGDRIIWTHGQGSSDIHNVFGELEITATAVIYRVIDIITKDVVFEGTI